MKFETLVPMKMNLLNFLILVFVAMNVTNMNKFFVLFLENALVLPS